MNRLCLGVGCLQSCPHGDGDVLSWFRVAACIPTDSLAGH